MTEPTYDPETCVTAGQLRRIGFGIPDLVPEMAWVSKSDISKEVDVDASPGYGGTHSLVALHSPSLFFRWDETDERAPSVQVEEFRYHQRVACVPSPPTA
jgi:hypothetical protein